MSTMNSALTIILSVGTVIAAPADLSFPRLDYYGDGEVAVRNVDSSSVQIPIEIQKVMNKERSPAKDIYSDVYVPLPDPSENDVVEIRRKLLSQMFYVPIPVPADGFRLFLIDTRKVGDYKRHVYSDLEYNIYAKV